MDFQSSQSGKTLCGCLTEENLRNMKKLTYLLFAFILLISCGENAKIGKYTKEPLPENFSYEIINDESNSALEKNQLEIELSQKLTEGQIATLAEELFNSKDKQRRFTFLTN